MVCDELLVLPGQTDMSSWLLPKEFVSEGVALAAEMALVSARGTDPVVSQECASLDDGHDSEELIVLPGQLDIHSWMTPKEAAFEAEGAGSMEDYARRSAELADEDAARSMGLAFDLSAPDELPKE